jgi:hypothetical protein
MNIITSEWPGRAPDPHFTFPDLSVVISTDAYDVKVNRPGIGSAFALTIASCRSEEGSWRPTC